MALRDKAPESDFRGYFSDTEIKLGEEPRCRGISSTVRFSTALETDRLPASAFRIRSADVGHRLRLSLAMR
jgi:hypothetical protein